MLLAYLKKYKIKKVVDASCQKNLVDNELLKQHGEWLSDALLRVALKYKIYNTKCKSVPNQGRIAPVPTSIASKQYEVIKADMNMDYVAGLHKWLAPISIAGVPVGVLAMANYYIKTANVTREDYDFSRNQANNSSAVVSFFLVMISALDVRVVHDDSSYFLSTDLDSGVSMTTMDVRIIINPNSYSTPPISLIVKFMEMLNGHSSTKGKVAKAKCSRKRVGVKAKVRS